MKDIALTNILLAVIAVLLLANLLTQAPLPKVEAETFKLDNCVTEKPGDKPSGYVHVVTH